MIKSNAKLFFYNKKGQEAVSEPPSELMYIIITIAFLFVLGLIILAIKDILK